MRCIISNVERLSQFAVGAERDLYAAAMRFQVKITCFEVILTLHATFSAVLR